MQGFTEYRVNFALVKYCASKNCAWQVAAFDAQFNYCILMLNVKLSCQLAVGYSLGGQMSELCWPV